MRAAFQAFAVVTMVAMGTSGVGCASSGKGPFVRSSRNAAFAVHDGVNACGAAGCLEVGKGERTFWLRDGKLASAHDIALCVDTDGAIGSGVVLRDCAESRARWLSAFYDKKAVLIDRTTDLCLAIPEAERGAEMVRCGSDASGMVLAPLATE